MFEIKIAESEKQGEFGGSAINLLKKAIDSISEMVEDAELKVTDKGLMIQVMDSMHVCLANIFLSKNAFTEYRCDRNLTLGIKLKSFNKILKGIRIEKERVFQLYCEDESNQLVLSFESSSYKLCYKLKLYSFDKESYSFPELDYPAMVTINIEDFLLLPKTVGNFADFLTIEVTKESVSFLQGGEIGESSLTLMADQEKGVLINVTEPVKLEMSMKYINYMSKISDLCTQVSISLGNEMPMFFDFSLNDLGYLRFYVASKVEN